MNAWAKKMFLCKLRVTVSSVLLWRLWGKKSKLLSAQGDGSTGGHDVQDGFKRAGIRELVR